MGRQLEGRYTTMKKIIILSILLLLILPITFEKHSISINKAKALDDATTKVAQELCLAIQNENSKCLNKEGIYAGNVFAERYCMPFLRSSNCTDKACLEKVICEKEIPLYGGTIIKVKDTASFCGGTPNSFCETQGGNNSGGNVDDSKSGRVDEEDPYTNYDASNCYGFGDAVYYITMVIKILQIAAPILLIIWASIDLIKSLTSSDEKTIIAKRKPIIQRFIAAALVFIVPTVVIWIVDGASINADEDSWLTCWKKNGFKYTSGKTSEELDEIEQKISSGCTSICKLSKNLKSSLNCEKKCVSSYNNSCDNFNGSELDSCIDTYLKEWYNSFNR